MLSNASSWLRETSSIRSWPFGWPEGIKPGRRMSTTTSRRSLSPTTPPPRQEETRGWRALLLFCSFGPQFGARACSSRASPRFAFFGYEGHAGRSRGAVEARQFNPQSLRDLAKNVPKLWFVPSPVMGVESSRGQRQRCIRAHAAS